MSSVLRILEANGVDDDNDELFFCLSRLCSHKYSFCLRIFSRFGNECCYDVFSRVGKRDDGRTDPARGFLANIYSLQVGKSDS